VVRRILFFVGVLGLFPIFSSPLRAQQPKPNNPLTDTQKEGRRIFQQRSPSATRLRRSSPKRYGPALYKESWRTTKTRFVTPIMEVESPGRVSPYLSRLSAEYPGSCHESCLRCLHDFLNIQSGPISLGDDRRRRVADGAPLLENSPASFCVVCQRMFGLGCCARRGDEKNREETEHNPRKTEFSEPR